MAVMDFSPTDLQLVFDLPGVLADVEEQRRADRERDRGRGAATHDLIVARIRGYLDAHLHAEDSYPVRQATIDIAAACRALAEACETRAACLPRPTIEQRKAA